MEMSLGFIFLLIATFASTHLVEAQDQTGFISLDCGLMPKDNSYPERGTNITYTSDANFTESGVIKGVSLLSKLLFDQHEWYVRSFPEGARNCYHLNLRKGDKYLIRATFLYGDYDNLTQYPSFDIHIGSNKWASVEIAYTYSPTVLELVHLLTSNHLHICLVKTGPTTPFITSLELRPLSNSTYITQSGSLMTFARLHTKNDSGTIRFPDDVHDRIWSSVPINKARLVNTSRTIDTNDGYDVPQLVLRTAMTSENANESLSFSWSTNDTNSKFYAYLHFADIETLESDESREFNITYNGKPWFGSFRPPKFKAQTLYSSEALASENGSYVIELLKTGKSKIPPILNAVEFYTVLEFSEPESDENDVNAILNIKAIYGLKRINWQGDPCGPKEFLWNGLNCSNKHPGPPRITSLNLSSSGLTGQIAPSIDNLNQLTELDLSNNSLTGGVPEFLSKMKSLLVINLSQNQLNGSVPLSLIKRNKNGSLNLNVEGNPNLCALESCHKKPKHFVIPVVASVASVAVLLIILLASFLILRRRKQTSAKSALVGTIVEAKADKAKESPILTKERRFTLSEVLKMTNNMERVLGKGGFGVVYHGYLNDTDQVAVKVLSQSSAQGYKQFKAEVELLLRVHHRNLVSLVGYCEEGDNLALIYEYMANGDLKETLLGKHGNNPLVFADRLRIAAEAAQGLEYLHNGCKPPMVHRDVKTSNILLSEHFQGKLADFGLSRSFPIEGETHVSTVVAGTPGYLDPEYYATNWLTEKSDVYSFGIVLLEIITNRAVIDNTRERPHITQWVGFMLTDGDIKRIIDPKLQGGFDTNTVWRVLELAMACVNPSSSRRPNMAYVVMELSECLAAETAGTQGSRLELESKSSPEVSMMSFGSELTPGAR